MEPFSYTWIFVVAIIVALCDAFGIGANDIANSFATSVASRSLKLWQACLIAVFTELGGALLLGAPTAQTIRNNIIDVSLFESQPELLMVAMMSALCGSATWVLLATRLGAPVSSTHSIVGGVMGAGIAIFGPGAVHWGVDGFARIVISWFISPVLAGVIAALLYSATKYGVMRRKNSFRIGLTMIPFYFTATFALILFFMVYDGSPALGLEDLDVRIIAGVVVGASVFIGILSQIFLVPYLRRTLQNGEIIPVWKVPAILCLGEQPKHSVPADDTKPTDSNVEMVTVTPKELDEAVAAPVTETSTPSSASSISTEGTEEEKPTYNPFVWVYRAFRNHLNNTIFSDIAGDQMEEHADMHARAVKYDSTTEELFSFLQISTASFASFAHGANDLSNAFGPLATVYLIWMMGDVTGTHVPVPVWIVAACGVMLDLGLVLYGHKIMRSLGNHLTYQTPSRGFNMELGAMLTVLIASKLGLPVSTTHCITGATTGVGLCNGELGAVNWRLLAWCFCSWIITVPCAGLVSGLICAALVHAPTVAGYTGA